MARTHGRSAAPRLRAGKCPDCGARLPHPLVSFCWPCHHKHCVEGGYPCRSPYCPEHGQPAGKAA